MNRLRQPGLLVSLGATLLLAIIAVVGAGSLRPATVDLLTTLLLYIAGASAWNIIGGFGGLFSLANSAFVGAGAYTTAVLLARAGLSVPVALLASALVGAVIALVVGGILLRLRGAYFTVGTLAVSMVALTWMTIWEFTGATRGINVPLAVAPRREELYLFAVVLAVVVLLSAIAIAHSPFGLRLMAVRDDEDVADSLGVNPRSIKLVAMMVSGVFTALVGAIFALQNIAVEPYSAFSLNWSMSFIVMAILGGLGTVWGPPLGALIIYFGLTVQLRQFPTLSTIVSGILLLLIIRFFPLGVLGAVRLGLEGIIPRLRASRSSLPAAEPVESSEQQPASPVERSGR